MLVVRSVPTASKFLGRERVIWGCMFKASSGALCAVHRGADDIQVSVSSIEDLPMLQFSPSNPNPALSIRDVALS